MCFGNSSNSDNNIYNFHFLYIILKRKKIFILIDTLSLYPAPTAIYRYCLHYN